MKTSLLLVAVLVPSLSGAALPPLRWSHHPDMSGSPVPVSSYPASGDDMAVDSQGNVVVTTIVSVSIGVNGTSVPGVNRNTWKYSAGGQVVWSIPTGGHTLEIDAADNIYVAALSPSPMVTKISAAGVVLWTHALSFTPTRLAVSPDASVYVCGQNGFALRKITDAGTEAWTRRYNGSGGADGAATCLIAMSDNGAVAAGWSTETDAAGTGRRWMIIRYSSAGAYQWGQPGEPGQVDDIIRVADDLVAAGSDFAGAGYPMALIFRRIAASGGIQVWRTPHAPVSTADLVRVDKLRFRQLAADANGSICAVFSATGLYDHDPEYFGMDYHTFTKALRLDGAGAGKLETTLVSLFSIQEDGNFAGVNALPGGGFLVEAFDNSTLLDTTGAVIEQITRHDGTHSPAAAAVGSSGFYRVGCRIGGYSGCAYGFDYMLERRAEIEPALPIVTSTPASPVLRQSATLNGTVDPKEQVAEYWFEYGPTSAYGSATPRRNMAEGITAATAVSESVAVTPGTTWHFRAAASTSAGTAYGQDQVFTTPTSPWGEFVLRYFGSAGAPGSGLEDDPDGDGLPNFVEHAFGTSPLIPGGAAITPEYWTSPDSGISYISLVFTPVEDITYAAEASNTLTGTWTGAGTQILSLPDGGRRAVALGFQHFLRLRVTYAP